MNVENINLQTILNIWDVIIKSNTFNFIIFVLILAWIMKKIDLGGIITILQQKIIKLIEDAKKEKENSLIKLSQAEESVKTLAEELNTIIEEAEKSAEVMSEKLLDEAKKQIEIIEFNAKKVIEAEEKFLKSTLAKNTSKASVDAAKSHIKNTLKETPSLHEKYINDSIEELDRLNF
jgi:F0F1-type ATP synthase membrane subunit b/b'